MLFSVKRSSQMVAIGIAALLSACGGGGGSSSTTSNPTTPVTVSSTINSSNQSTVTALGYSSLVSMNGQVELSSLVTGVSVVPASTNTGLLDILLATSYKALALTPQSLVTGVTTTQSSQCSSGGSIQITANLSSSTAFSSGDSLTLAATNCLENGVLINGSFNMALSNISGTATSTGNWSGSIAMTMNNFTVQNGTAAAVAINGGMTLGLNKTSSSVSYTVSGTSLSESSSGTTVTMSNFSYNGSRSGTTYTYSANLTETINSPSVGTISYTVVTTTPFVQVTGNNPTQGAFTIKASDNTSIIGTVVATGIQIQLDATGTGNYGASTIVPWSSL